MPNEAMLTILRQYQAEVMSPFEISTKTLGDFAAFAAICDDQGRTSAHDFVTLRSRMLPPPPRR